MQFLNNVTLVEDYILLLDQDMVFVHPPKNWATKNNPAACPYSYIRPDKHIHLITSYNPKRVPVRYIYSVGGAPVIMHQRQWRKVVPEWHRIALKMRKDPMVQMEFGWVQEMYAFTVAAATVKGGPIHFRYHPEMMVIPPYASSLAIQPCAKCKNTTFNIIHYTMPIHLNASGNYVNDEEHAVWMFNKRDYVKTFPPQEYPSPPRTSPQIVTTLMNIFNGAATETPGWSEMIIEVSDSTSQNK